MSEPRLIDGETLRRQWPLPAAPPDGDKNERGTVVVVGGAVSTPGAAMLAGLAALRVGAGRLSIATVESTAAAVAVATPEAGVTALPAAASGSLGAAAVTAAAELAAGADAVVVGPGLTDPDDTRSLVEGLVAALPAGLTVVLDALALTCGAIGSVVAAGPSERFLITPNRSEAARLLDVEPTGPDHLTALRLAEAFGCHVVYGSAVAAPDQRCWRSLNGNIGLGTSGSGDVLAGAVAGIAARCGDRVTAALWGLSLHAGAGDRLAQRVGQVGFLARELLDELPLGLPTTAPRSSKPLTR